MKFLKRHKLLDLACDSDDLCVAARFWLRLYTEAAWQRGLPELFFHTTEIRLRGFPRADGERLAAALRDRAGSHGFENATVAFPDPDTLSIRTDERPNSRPRPAGFGLPLLLDVGCEGLMVEFRMRASTGPHAEKSLRSLKATLVLVGEVRDGAFRLQAAWRVGVRESEDDIFWIADWPDQERWLAGLREFRAKDKVSVTLAMTLFAPRSSALLTTLELWLLNVHFGEPRLGRLALRAAIFFATFALIVLGTWATFAFDTWKFWLLPLGLLALFSGFVFYEFMTMQVKVWFQGYAENRFLFKRLFASPTVFSPISPREADAIRGFSPVRKYTADLLAAGFTHAGDLASGDEKSESVYRVFLAPDGVSYILVTFIFSSHLGYKEWIAIWPAKVLVLGYTYFPGGAYLGTSSHGGSEYRKKRSGPHVRERLFLGVSHPVEFAECHAKAAKAYGEELGQSAIPHEPFEAYLKRFNAGEREECEANARGSPYTLVDHIYWFLQLTRSEYLE